MSNCVFCKIVTGELPCYKVFENDKFLGFLDINPIAPGHIQLIPKIHYRWTYDVPNFGQYFETAKIIAVAAQKAVKSDYVSFVTFGVEVNHAHIWIVPRFAGDIHAGHGINTDNRLNFTEKQYQEFQRQITATINP